MGGFAVSARVQVRNSMGRYIADCEQAGQMVARDLVDMGADLSREYAPVGSKPDLRSIPISQSIVTKMLSRTSGVWQSLSGHALHQEFGTRPHTMYGNPYFRFFWESKGRMWEPGLFGEQDIINHPGHGAQPFLRPAYHEVMDVAMEVARAHYPG